MAAVMIGGMVPSLATALAVTLFPALFSPEERQRGFVNYLLGLCFISEGALPFLASSPLELIFACAVGGGLGGALSMCMNCSIPAPHGGIFVFPLAQKPGWRPAGTGRGQLDGGPVVCPAAPRSQYGKSGKKQPKVKIFCGNLKRL